MSFTQIWPLNNLEHISKWKILCKTNFSWKPHFSCSRPSWVCSQHCAVLSLVGNKALQKLDHDYSLTKETMRPVFSANNSLSWSDRTEKPFLCLFLLPLFPMTKRSHCWRCSPDLDLLGWLRVLVSCKHARQRSAWPPVFNTALPWRERLKVCCLLWFWGQLLSESAGAARSTALVLAWVIPQHDPCLGSYRMQGLVRPLKRENVLRLICPVPLEIESVRCPWRFFVTAPAYQEHCLLRLLVAQGPDLGDARRDMWLAHAGVLLGQRKVPKVLPHTPSTRVSRVRLLQAWAISQFLRQISWCIIDGQNMRWKYKALLCLMVNLLGWHPEC